jgi:hypothetical protein
MVVVAHTKKQAIKMALEAGDTDDGLDYPHFDADQGPFQRSV